MSLAHLHFDVLVEARNPYSGSLGTPVGFQFRNLRWAGEIEARKRLADLKLLLDPGNVLDRGVNRFDFDDPGEVNRRNRPGWVEGGDIGQT